MQRSLFAVLVLLAAGAGMAAAQESGTPDFKAPYRSFQAHEIGATISFPENADFGLEGFYTYGYNRFDIGLRGGFVNRDVAGDDQTRLALGGSFRARVIESTQQFPLDGALTVGLGGQFGEGDDAIFIPVGLSLGRRFQVEGSNTTFVPYVHPVLVPILNTGAGDDDVEFALGLGANVRFGGSVELRVSGGIGEIEGIAIGLAFVR
ncbi:MAG TPA: hypothetical protein VFU46_09390 [Gemmatimonadales bacterium]|nr:hypothetical protein [Gemmatimonadales bacterium]